VVVVVVVVVVAAVVITMKDTRHKSLSHCFMTHF
jgi:hypothetical protein